MNSAVSTTNDDSTAVLIKEARESLSLSQRLSHSNWRVRSDALDSINAVLLPFQDVDHEHQYEDSTVTYDDVLGCRGVSVEVGKAIAKAVGDVNANVMDMALETYRMYLRCLGYIIINGGCVDGSMVEQMAEISLSAKGIGGACLKAQKRSTVSKAVEVCMELIELGVWEVVVRNVVDIGFVNKVPKGVVGATEVVLEAVRSFDAGAFDQEGFAKAVVGGIVKTKVYSHANNGVRSNVKDILVGLMVKKNKRIDGIVRALLFEQLPDVMKKDIVSNVEQYGSDGTAAVTVTRYSKVQRAEMALREGDEDGGGEDLAHDADVEMMDVDEVEEGPSEDVDPYEFAEPKDVMTSLHKTKVKIVGGDGESQEDVLFWDCFESKKWNVRKSAVEMLCDVLTRAVRLDPSCQQEYSSVVRELKKILAKDANIHCAAGAAMAGEALAKGLRRDFSGLAKQMCPDILQRFKEKNPVMCQAADSCLQTFGTYCYSLKDVSDDIAHALKHKNPKVRYDTLRYVSFLVDKETKQSVSQCKDTLAAAVQLSPDADGKIREEAQKVIVEYGRKMGGFHAVKPYLNGLDASRRDIIEKALLESGSRPKETSTKRLEVKKPAPSKPVQKKVAESVGRSKSAAVTKKPAAASLQAKTPSTASKPSMSDSMNSIKNTVSEEDAEEFLIQNFGAELVENLKSPLWQGRLAAMTDILDRAREVPSMGMLLLSLAKVPGWDDKNFQVLNKILEVCTVVAEDSNEFGAVHASCVVEGAVEKIHELKHRSQATKSLTASCERVGPRLVVSLVHQKAAWHKNPKVLAESLFWIGNTIDQFGYAEIDNKGSISAWMKDDLGSSNAAVRAQALNLLGICHSQVGQGPFQSLIDSLKPALVTSLQESFAKKPLDSSYEPSLLVKANVPDVDVNDFAADDIVNAMSAATVLEEEAPAVDLNFTRVDVSGSLNDALVAKMMSKNWKERNAAVESVEEILSSAKHITPDLSTDFLSALRARFGDANRNLAARSISLVGQLALAVGAPFDKIAHGVLLSPAILNLSDTKKQVRDAVVVMLDAWASTCPKERMFPALADAVSNPKGHPEGKVVALKWMVDNYVADSAKCKEVGHKASKTAAADKVAAVRDMGAQLSSLCSGSSASVASRPASAKKTPMPKKPVVSKTPARSVPRDKSSKTSIEQTPAKSVKRNIAKNDVEYDEPLISMGHGKGTRSKQFRPKPGGFEPPSAADVAKLQEMLAPVLSTAIRSQMFSNQFQDHVMALESLIDAASQLMSEILTSLDLILQWTVYILCEANTQSSIRALDLLRVILENVCDDGYRLNDMEAAILLPAVIEKSGQNQDYLRSAYRTIIVLAASTVNPAKVIDYIIVGLGSKNSRTRVECCLALSEIVRQHGGRFAASAKNKPVLALSQFVSDRDVVLRSASINAIQAIYDALDDAQFEALMNKVRDSDRCIIENKLHRSSQKQGSPVVHPEPIDITRTPAAAPLISEPPEEHTLPVYQEPRTYDDGHRASLYQYQSVQKTPEHVGNVERVSVETPAPAYSHAQLPQSDVVTPVPVALETSPNVEHYERDDIDMIPNYDEEEFLRRWEHCVELLYTSDLSVSVEATKQMCSDIMLITSKENPPPSKRVLAFMANSADRFFLGICAQLELIFADAEQQLAMGGEAPGSRGCKFALNALLQGLSIEEVAKSVPQATLRTTISLLLCSLVDDNGLLSFDQGTTLVRAVNVLIAKMLDSVDKNYAFAALLHLLRSPPKTLRPEIVPKYNDLVVKCLIKLTKGLDNGAATIDLSFLLMCLHDYFMYLGVEEIRKRSAAEDKPLRMVKTILHQVCKLAGYSIYQYTTGIPGRHSQPQPIIFRYIDINLKMLKEMNQLPAESEIVSGPPVKLETTPYKVTATPELSAEEEAKIKLKDILSRVTSKDAYMKDAAMRELLDVKRRHPAMLDRYLRGTQDKFRAYIEESLQTLESSPPVPNQGTYTRNTSLSYARERLGSMYGTPKEQSGALRKPSDGSMSVDLLAERMARLKQNKI